VTLAIGDEAIGVRFSRASAANAFAERFGDMLSPIAPKAVIFAVTSAGKAYFWRTPERARFWPDDPSDELLVFFADNVALHEYLTTGDAMGIHAAVIASASHLVALVGVSTAGKTTTAIAAVRNGFALYSDERCIIERGRVVPFLRAMTIRTGGRAALLADQPLRDRVGADACTVTSALRALPADGEATIRPRALAGALAGGSPRPLDSIFIIEGRDAAPAAEPCSPYAVLPALTRSMLCRESGLARMSRLLSELQGVATYRLRLGSPDGTVKAIESVLR
jgi:hypothetical protein